VRRTQAERSATTQQALTKAAIDTLVERGWAATTAVEVCERAGVTRGALMHHYPSLAALLAAALQTLYDDVAATAPRVRSLRALLDFTWDRLGRREMKAMFEAWLAAANNRDLAAEIGPVVASFSKLVDPHELPDVQFLDTPDAISFYLVAREAMLGLAMGRATTGGAGVKHEKQVLARLRAEASAFDAQRKAAS
jgi:AcrR family transcriptional regulator